MAFSAIELGKVTLGEGHPLVVISGPCVIEDEKHALMCAETLQQLCERVQVQLIYKASYDKANRSASASFRGPGINQGLAILRKVKETFGLPVLTDIHHPEEADRVAEVCDVLQIPAFLCRQTDLLIAAGKTQRPVNIKKGQFLAPWDMRYVVEKVATTGNDHIILTERGTTFGYNNLISDLRSIPIMQKLKVPVCFDASHSVQLPGGAGHQSGGEREFIPTLTQAAIGAGADLLFIESHPDPVQAKSDAASVMPFQALEPLLRRAAVLFNHVRDGT
ncbi:MAG: 3-deoxy-8-phosphooctulonate synthase [Chlamydiota bacterium]